MCVDPLAATLFGLTLVDVCSLMVTIAFLMVMLAFFWLRRKSVGVCTEGVLTYELTLVDVCSLLVTSLFSLLLCWMMHWI